MEGVPIYAVVQLIYTTQFVCFLVISESMKLDQAHSDPENDFLGQEMVQFDYIIRIDLCR